MPSVPQPSTDLLEVHRKNYRYCAQCNKVTPHYAQAAVCDVCVEEDAEFWMQLNFRRYQAQVDGGAG